MAKRDKDAAKKGFQIHIEDADEQVKEAADLEEQAEDVVEAGGEDAASATEKGADASAAAEEKSDKASDKTDNKASDKTNDEANSKIDDETNGKTNDEASDEDDLIAEAEAIVEEASAAEQLEAAQAKMQDWQDRYMRLHAEWDTYRRRTQEQRAEERVRATEKLMEDLLPVLDDFERTVSYATENGEQGLLDGVKAVQAKLHDALKKSGLETIDPAGQPYDALEAQAVQMVPDEKAFEETVKDVYQKGYKMGKKVLRAAMVTVTTGGPKRPKEEEAEE